MEIFEFQLKVVLDYFCLRYLLYFLYKAQKSCCCPLFLSFFNFFKSLVSLSNELNRKPDLAPENSDLEKGVQGHSDSSSTVATEQVEC
jgi:hypothetical protein